VPNARGCGNICGPSRKPLTIRLRAQRSSVERCAHGSHQRAKSGIRKRLRYAPGAIPVVRLNRRRKKAASS